MAGGFLSWLFSTGSTATPRRQATARQQDIQRLNANVKAVMTPERQELIRQAMAIRQSKSKILDDLGDEQKRKLYALAVKNLLRSDDDGK